MESCDAYIAVYQSSRAGLVYRVVTLHASILRPDNVIQIWYQQKTTTVVRIGANSAERIISPGFTGIEVGIDKGHVS